MNQIFKIQRKSGTYAELLEAYGLANLLNNFLQANNSISLHAIDDSFYEIELHHPLPDNVLDTLQYFPLFKYIKTKFETDVSQYPDYYDYPELKVWKKERQELLNKTYKETNKVKRENDIKNIETYFDINKPIPYEFDVVSQLINPNVYSGFDKLYQNFFVNKSNFTDFINEIMCYYSDENYKSTKFDKLIKNLTFDKNPTATQLLNPSQGKGLKATKANSVSGGNFNSSWISETMKISGALSDMICQLVKVGNSYDLKIFVPEYKDVNYNVKTDLLKKFKKYLKGSTPVKIDILSILLLTQLVIEHLGFTGLRSKVKDIISGLHSVYQKDLGQNKAVVNIGFIQVPEFIEISSREENDIWINILEEQRQIIGSISTKTDTGKIIETGNEFEGLVKYRNFISGGNLDDFFTFSHWYSVYLSTELSNKRYARLFSIETLNKFYNSMDTKELKLADIINDDGFKAVANAIRKSTVTLQYTPKDARKYEIRYGVAQTLQNKSKSKEDLTEFIGEFVALYNAETARYKEKTGSNFRSNVREKELDNFYLLLDKFPAKLVGALLASYGFALHAKDSQVTNDNENINENIEVQ
jgi:hypothetical protein